MTTPLDAFVQLRQRGAELLESLADEVVALGEANNEDSHSRQLRAVAERARQGRFVVLLLGCFSSGKSTLLNALLGRPVLPVKVNPCTAILTEVVYGEEPAVEVRYNDGRSETFDVDGFIEAFQLRTASTEEAGAEASDRFGNVDRAILSYPLHILENGVVLLDTPGLDDDEIRTTRTLASLPDADAVIVVLSATRFLTDLERRTLRRNLLPLGLTNLFFPVTMVDLLDAISDEPERDLEELHRKGREVLGPLCQVEGDDRFEERFFPLDARGGLLSRWDRKADAPLDPVATEAWTGSGVEAFEAALEQFLIQDRGRAELRHLENTARRIRDDLSRQAELDRATASASVDELKQRQKELLPKFEELDTIAVRVGRTVDRFIERQRSVVWQDLRDFMARTEDALPEAVAEFDLGGLASMDLLTPRGRARIEARLREELEAWLETRVAEWQRSLRPRLEGALHQLRVELAGDAQDFDDVADRIVTDFVGGAFQLPDALGAQGKVDPVERWFSVAVGAVLLSPGAVAAGWSEGYEGALKGAASRLGVRLAILTLGALLGPIGWVGLVLYVVSDAVLLVLTGGGQLKRLRDKVADRLQGKLVGQADSAREDIENQVAEGLAPLRDGLVGAARDEADELKSVLERTIAAREQAALDAASRDAQWTAALARFDTAIEALESLVIDTA